jgi:protein-disulfide isomerase
MNTKFGFWSLAAVGLFGIAVGFFAVVVFRPSLLSGHVTEAVVRDTLRAHPELVLEALQTLQDRQANAERMQSGDAIAAHRDALLNDPNSFVAGNREGDVTVVEFFDYRCPYCRQSMATVAALIKQDPKLRVVYKELPILGPQSMTAARLAVAARNDARYERLHDALMTAPAPLDEDAVLRIAAELGLDRAAMADAMKAPEIDQILQANRGLARDLGISGTPAFIIGDTLVPGVAGLDDLKALVAAERARGGDRAGNSRTAG